jgi:glutamyl/glutaminyl-tRNA synthetase
MTPRTPIAPSPTGHIPIGGVRVAITSATIGFDLPEAMVLLDREKVLERIEAAMKFA